MASTTTLWHTPAKSRSFKEAKKSLEILARSDSGQPWQHAIHNELSLLNVISGQFRGNRAKCGRWLKCGPAPPQSSMTLTQTV